MICCSSKSECRKTKLKVSSLANHKGYRYSEPIKLRSDYMQLAKKARGNVCKRVYGFGFIFHWMRNWRKLFLSQSCCVAIQNNYFSIFKYARTAQN